MLACMKELQTFADGSMPEKVITTEIWIPTGAIHRPISERCNISAVFSQGCPKKRVFLCGLWGRSIEMKMNQQKKVILKDA